MRHHRLTRRARADIDELAAYIAAHNPAAAVRVIDSIHAAAKQLGRMPGIGHRRPDLAAGSLRFWPVHSYLLVYRRAPAGVEVLRVLHAARDVGRILAEEE